MAKSSDLMVAPPLPSGFAPFPTAEEFWAWATQIPVPSRDTGLGPIQPWGTQREFIRQMLAGLHAGKHQFLVAKAGQVGQCVHPSTRILTANLEWREAGSIQVGDELVSVSEFAVPPGKDRQKSGGRKFERAVVQATREAVEPAFEILLANGTRVISSAQHRWLSLSPAAAGKHGAACWRSIEPPRRPPGRAGRPPTVALGPGFCLRRICDVWDGGDIEDGWMGGIIDGEGNIYVKKYGGGRISVAQVAGPVWDRIVLYFKERGYHARIAVRKTPNQLGSRPVCYATVSRLDQLFRLAGQTRPTRALWPWWQGKSLPGRRENTGNMWVPITSVTPIGATRLIDLQTTTRTFIAEGLVSHNSLAMQLVSIYWMLRYPGLQGVCGADADDNREFFRDNISTMAAKAPDALPFRLNNKNVLVWESESRLLFQTAGPRTGKRMGVGRGFAFNWNTEVPLWQNPQSFTYLRTRFSDAHPARLSVSEGTSRGKNWWYDVWEEAADASDICRIFLAWWMREDYTLEPESDNYQRYWNGVLTARERRWTKALAKDYKRTLTPGQWAWRRWFVSEKAGGDERTADQEMPTLVEDSFEATGVSFLSLEAVRRCRRTVAAAQAPKPYRYEFGLHLEDTRVKPTIPAHGQLAVWEEPMAAQGYVVAAVPAHSATPECPVHVVSVWKASRETLEQVAEFSDEDCGMQPFAWVCAGLSGSYATGRRAFILEIGGMGAGVLQELQRLQSSGWGTAKRAAIANILGSVGQYVYRRADSMAGGAARQMKVSPELRMWLLNRLRDQLASGTVILRSPAALEEMERVRQVGDVFMPEGQKTEDHRVVAAALAVESWSSQLKPIFERVQGRSRATTVTGKMIETFFDDLRAKPATAGRRW